MGGQGGPFLPGAPAQYYKDTAEYFNPGHEVEDL